jgi:hypothetical protein
MDMLEENNEDFTLPPDAFVFSMYQGYEFKYFLLSDGDDPPVYQYVQNHGLPVMCWESFTAFLVEAINDHSPYKGIDR